MKDIITNNWFIGITSSIISTLLYYIFTSIIAKMLKKENIAKANNEILTVLKPYIIDIGFPEIEIVSSLIEATARKYKIQSSQMYTIENLCDELIKEITESIYITSEKKNEYNKQLIEYKKIVERNVENTCIENQKEDFRNRLDLNFFMTIPITFATMVILLLSEKYKLNKVEKQNFLFMLIPVLMVMLVIAIMLSIRIIIRRLKGEKK